MIAATDWWSTGADLAVAVGTGALAIFTAFLGVKTRETARSAELQARASREQAEASRQEAAAANREADAVREQAASVAEQARVASEQLKLTRQSLEASTQPWLILGDADDRTPNGVLRPRVGQSSGNYTTPPIWVGHEKSEAAGVDRIHASIAVRNIGNGLALIDPQRCWILGYPDPRNEDQQIMQYTHAEVRQPILGQGDQTSLEFLIDLRAFSNTFEAVTHSNQTSGELHFDITYSDIAGGSTVRARLRVASMHHGQVWVPHRVEYFSPPDGEASTVVKYL